MGSTSGSTDFLPISPVTPKSQLGPTKPGMPLNIARFWTALLAFFCLFFYFPKEIFPPHAGKDGG